MSDKRILHKVEHSERGADFIYWCPGCQETHGVWTEKKNGLGAVWQFNGSMERPTFSPSVLLKYVKNPPVDSETGAFKRGADGKYLTGPDGRILGCKDVVCHFFIRDGQMQFLGDCTHELAGKTVPMVAF